MVDLSAHVNLPYDMVTNIHIHSERNWNTMDKFVLKLPCPDPNTDKQPVIRLKSSYYQTLSILKARTGLSLGNIVEQYIDYALEHLEENPDENN